MARLRFPLPQCILFLLTALLAANTLPAQSRILFPGTTAVGATGPTQSVPVTIRRSGTLDSQHVRSGGADGFDFALAAGGTCQTGSTYIAGQTCTVAVSFKPVAPGARTGAVVLLDRTGAALGTAMLSASATGGLHVFVPGTMQTVAGQAGWLYGGDGAPATVEAIFLPFGVAVDTAGDFFIADSSNNRIRRVDATTGLMSTVAGNGLIGFSGDGGAATSASLSSPTSVVLDPAGNIFFTDSGNNIIRRIDAFDGTISTIAGTPGHHGFSGDGAPATGALLNAPNGIAFDLSGNLFLADSGNHIIRRIDGTTGLISTVAGQPGLGGAAGDGGLATQAYLSGPWGLTVAPSGVLFIADQGNHKVREVDLAGFIHTVAGTGTGGYNKEGIPATTAMLNAPAGVVVDVAGNIYIADSGNNRVRKINSSTGIISSVAGNDGQAYSGDGGPANIAGLYGPYTLALDSSGNLFIADVFHNRIRRVSANDATLQYPPMRVGRVSTPQQQIVENDGNSSMTISSIDLVTNSAIDPAATTCSSSTPLSPLDQCTVSISFAPTTIGKLVVGSALVRSDAGNAPGTLNLTGQVLSSDPSTAALTSATNPSQTGDPVTFTAGVSSVGVTPTGTITLLEGTTVLGTATLDKYGNASFTISGLKSGQHLLTASYEGDSSNTSATSPTLVQVVKDPVAATSTSLSSSSNPATAGASFRLTALIQTQVAGSGNGDITGPVTFKDGSTVLGTAAATGGTAVFVATLSTGQHSLTASYAGAAAYSASTSPALSEGVVIASSKAVLTSAVNPSSAGAPVTLIATLSSTGGTPGGSVTFTDGSATLGSATLTSAGVATLVVPGSSWTVGTHSLTATYAGDLNDQPSTSSPYPQVVNLAQTTTVLGSSANPVALGASTTFTATVTGSGGTPGGTVQFLDGSSLLGTATVDKTGVASLAISSLTLGSHTITAMYGGDSNDGASSSAPLNEQVQAATLSTALTTATNPALFGDPLTLAALVTATGSQPGGTVQYADGGTVIGTATLDPYGFASINTHTLTVGSHTLTATYLGDPNHGSAVSPVLTQRILQGTAISFTTSSPHVTAGNPIQWTVTVSGKAGLVPTGSVTLTDGTGALTTVTLDSRGMATYSSSTLAPGQHTLLATYPGDTNDAPSTSTALLELVDQATSSTSLTSSSNPADSGTPLLLTATVTSNGGSPTGKLTFLDGTAVLTSVALPANGVATFSTSTLAPGIHALTASYSGDTNTSASTSPVLSQRIAQRTSLTLASSSNPSLLSDTITLTVQAANGTATAPGGQVTLTDGGTAVASLAVNGSGTAVFTIPAPSLGLHTYLASYAGDPQNLPAVSPALIQEVDLRPTSTTFTSSSNSLSAGQTVVFVGVVQAPAVGGRVPTGTVTFASGTTVLGSGTISATGVVTATLTPPQGSFNVVATYSGDSLFSSSSSPALAIIVGPTKEFLLTTDPLSMSLKSGAHGTLHLTLTSAPTYTDTLALGCAGLPTYSTCTFSDNQIKVAGGIAHTLTVTMDTGAPLGSGATAQNRSTPSSALLCGLPAGALMLLLLRRKRIRSLGLFCALLLLGTLATLTGCGTSFVQQATPAGSYSFQIVASGNQTGVTGTTTVQLTVTQ